MVTNTNSRDLLKIDISTLGGPLLIDHLMQVTTAISDELSNAEELEARAKLSRANFTSLCNHMDGVMARIKGTGK